MKTLVPSGLLFAGLFVAGCNTPENMFMAGDTPIGTKPSAPVAKAAPATPATTVLVVKPKPVARVTNPPPVVVTTNRASVNPVVVVPDDSTPAPTKPAEVPASHAVLALPTVVTPDTSITGKVVAYNSAGRFVVLSFPVGPMPRQDQSVFLYRGGLKVGEIKITGPQRDNNTVGDVVTGDAQVGDEVRDQ